MLGCCKEAGRRGSEHQLSLKQRHDAALKSLLTGAPVYIFVRFSVRTAAERFLFSGERAQRDFTLIFFFFLNPRCSPNSEQLVQRSIHDWNLWEMAVRGGINGRP